MKPVAENRLREILCTLWLRANRGSYWGSEAVETMRSPLAVAARVQFEAQACGHDLGIRDGRKECGLLSFSNQAEIGHVVKIAVNADEIVRARDSHQVGGVAGDRSRRYASWSGDDLGGLGGGSSEDANVNGVELAHQVNVGEA